MEKMEIADRYKGLEKNVWVEFIQLAKDYQPLNLGQGFPDDLVPNFVLDCLVETVKDDNKMIHQYTRAFGLPRLVQAISSLYSTLLGTGVTIEPLSEVLVTNGAYGALFSAIMGHVNPGDEVIIIEPYFDCYEPMVRIAGGTPVFIPLLPCGESSQSSKEWKLDPQTLAKAFNHRTKAIIVNNPNNPLGKIFSKAELDEICDLCVKYNTIVISDDVYEHIVYEESTLVRVASLPRMWERTITIGSAGKTFSVTGWKLGWAYGPAHLIKNCQVVHQHCVHQIPTPIQEALARAFEIELSRLGQPSSYFVQLSQKLREKRDNLAAGLKELGLEPIIPEGGYFLLVDWTSLESKLDLTGEKDEEKDYKFVKWLSKTRGLQVIPPSTFYSKEHKHIGEKFVRFCFIKKDESLTEAVEILRQLTSELHD